MKACHCCALIPTWVDGGLGLVNVTLLHLTVWNIWSFILVHPEPAKPILFYFKFSP